MKIKIFEVFDYVLFACVLILVTMGIAFIYSSGINSEGSLVTNEYIKQIIWASFGIIIMILSSLHDYNKFERYSQNLYIGLLAVLLYTCLFGRYVNGARSWLGIGDFGIQPSEFGKIVFIV
ncbi:MAG TPA: rod shape-determining protein RodA, partial [Treponema sp.]|nr:rod shape-determining protein RodA [Treponema sp.]